MGAGGSTEVRHHKLNTLLGVIPEGCEQATFGMGCFWGAERKFWQQEGVVCTSVGYCGGDKEDPSYEQVCTGNTKHAEVVNVIFDPKKISYIELLHVFWSNHNPTQLNRQGNDRGTQYRTCIFYHSEEQKKQAESTKSAFQKKLTENSFGEIVTEISDAKENKYYYAEEYHQQYLSKNPGGYCGLKGTGCYEPGEINGILDSL
mmetsp:Transcript_127741/g.190365  ORF Transcript_127741/g.190365 Transcript_127741/m.190365 type:complete len:203 (+) Transcript_127741:71-679(+)